MVNENIQVNLTFTQQLTISKLNTKLAALKIERDGTLQELNEFIQLCTIELNIPKGAVFDQKSTTFIMPLPEPKQPPVQIKE